MTNIPQGIRFIGESTNSNRLTPGEVYLVETSPNVVNSDLYEKDKTVTVWNNQGDLHEIPVELYEEASYKEIQEVLMQARIYKTKGFI